MLTTALRSFLQYARYRGDQTATPATIRRILEHLDLWALPARPPPVPLVQGKIDALTARADGNRPAPPEDADGVFVDDVPVYAG